MRLARPRLNGILGFRVRVLRVLGFWFSSRLECKFDALHLGKLDCLCRVEEYCIRVLEAVKGVQGLGFLEEGEMKAGRKNLKRGALEQGVEAPKEGHVLMRVVGLRGGNIVEAENAAGENTLCLLPAKFQKTIWVKTGTIVIVDEADREKAIEAGSKVTGTISRVLLEDQVRAVRKSASWWPESFKDERLVYKDASDERVVSSKIEEVRGDGSVVGVGEDDNDSDDDDGLPPLEANSNRQHAMSIYEHVESEDSSDDEESKVDKSKHALP